MNAVARPLRILLVEDNPVNQKVACALLRRSRHRVTIAENGLKALAALEQAQFDMVFMDVQMPEMDGLQATQRIRTDRNWQTLPIIAMTANAMDGDREACLAAGMNDYLPKPIDPKELELMVAKWNHGAEASSSPVAAESPKKGEPASEALAFDLNKALLMLGGDREVLDDVLSTFREDLPRMMDRLMSALRASDLAQLRAAAHSIKGSSSSVAAEELRAIAERLENASRAGAVSEVNGLIEQLQAEVERVREAVSSCVGQD